MTENVIIVEKLSKSYLIGHVTGEGGHHRYTALRDVISRGVHDFARKAADMLRGRQIVVGDTVEEFWALKDVSFEVKQGEVLGIIGSNGAGKSTLLKILSRITDPTEGRVTLRGRVASLLEVGTGFHPELSGRENIFLNGAILGMSQREIRAKFDEIVAFAEVERFLDTPVKRYSSGMYVRLAFAVAAHLEPEILVIDEVLAVGDAEFQRKCLGKMNEVSQRQGRTVLFVSHNMGVIASLCPNVIWLDQGSIRDRGNSKDILANYMLRRIPKRDPIVPLSHITRPSVIRDDRVRLESIEWLSELPLRHGEPVKARIRFKTRSFVSDAALGIGFSTFDGRRLLTYETDFQDGSRADLPGPGTYSADLEIESLPLAPDIYGLDIGFRSGDFHPLDYIPAALETEVVAGPNTPGYILRKDAGVRLASSWLWNLELPLRIKGQGETV